MTDINVAPTNTRTSTRPLVAYINESGGALPITGSSNSSQAPDSFTGSLPRFNQSKTLEEELTNAKKYIESLDAGNGRATRYTNYLRQKAGEFGVRGSEVFKEDTKDIITFFKARGIEFPELSKIKDEKDKWAYLLYKKDRYELSNLDHVRLSSFSTHEEKINFLKGIVDYLKEKKEKYPTFNSTGLLKGRIQDLEQLISKNFTSGTNEYKEARYLLRELGIEIAATRSVNQREEELEKQEKSIKLFSSMLDEGLQKVIDLARSSDRTNPEKTKAREEAKSKLTKLYVDHLFEIKVAAKLIETEIKNLEDQKNEKDGIPKSKEEKENIDKHIEALKAKLETYKQEERNISPKVKQVIEGNIDFWVKTLSEKEVQGENTDTLARRIAESLLDENSKAYDDLNTHLLRLSRIETFNSYSKEEKEAAKEVTRELCGTFSPTDLDSKLHEMQAKSIRSIYKEWGITESQIDNLIQMAKEKGVSEDYIRKIAENLFIYTGLPSSSKFVSPLMIAYQLAYKGNLDDEYKFLETVKTRLQEFEREASENRTKAQNNLKDQQKVNEDYLRGLARFTAEGVSFFPRLFSPSLIDHYYETQNKSLATLEAKQELLFDKCQALQQENIRLIRIEVAKVREQVALARNDRKGYLADSDLLRALLEYGGLIKQFDSELWKEIFGDKGNPGALKRLKEDGVITESIHQDLIKIYNSDSPKSFEEGIKLLQNTDWKENRNFDRELALRSIATQHIFSDSSFKTLQEDALSMSGIFSVLSTLVPSGQAGTMSENYVDVCVKAAKKIHDILEDPNTKEKINKAKVKVEELEKVLKENSNLDDITKKELTTRISQLKDFFKVFENEKLREMVAMARDKDKFHDSKFITWLLSTEGLKTTAQVLAVSVAVGLLAMTGVGAIAAAVIIAAIMVAAGELVSEGSYQARRIFDKDITSEDRTLSTRSHSLKWTQEKLLNPKVGLDEKFFSYITDVGLPLGEEWLTNFVISIGAIGAARLPLMLLNGNKRLVSQFISKSLPTFSKMANYTAQIKTILGDQAEKVLGKVGANLSGELCNGTRCFVELVLLEHALHSACPGLEKLAIILHAGAKSSIHATSGALKTSSGIFKVNKQNGTLEFNKGNKASVFKGLEEQGCKINALKDGTFEVITPENTKIKLVGVSRIENPSTPEELAEFFTNAPSEPISLRVTKEQFDEFKNTTNNEYEIKDLGSGKYEITNKKNEKKFKLEVVEEVTAPRTSKLELPEEIGNSNSYKAALKRAEHPLEILEDPALVQNGETTIEARIENGKIKIEKITIKVSKETAAKLKSNDPTVRQEGLKVLHEEIAHANQSVVDPTNKTQEHYIAQRIFHEVTAESTGTTLANEKKTKDPDLIKHQREIGNLFKAGKYKEVIEYAKENGLTQADFDLFNLNYKLNTNPDGTKIIQNYNNRDSSSNSLLPPGLKKETKPVSRQPSPPSPEANKQFIESMANGFKDALSDTSDASMTFQKINSEAYKLTQIAIARGIPQKEISSALRSKLYEIAFDPTTAPEVVFRAQQYADSLNSPILKIGDIFRNSVMQRIRLDIETNGKVTENTKALIDKYGTDKEIDALLEQLGLRTKPSAISKPEIKVSQPEPKEIKKPEESLPKSEKLQPNDVTEQKPLTTTKTERLTLESVRQEGYDQPCEVAELVKLHLEDELTQIRNDGKAGDGRVIRLLNNLCCNNFKVAARKSFRGNKNGETLDPAAEARRVLSDFLSKHSDKVDPGIIDIIDPPKSGANKTQFSNSITAPETLVQKPTDPKTGIVNPKGHVLKMRSEVDEVNISNENGEAIVHVKGNTPDFNTHQTLLNKVVSMLEDGNLVIYGNKDSITTKALLIEPDTMVKKSNGDQIALVCIHGQTNSRIWGEYNINTGEVVFRGIATDHNAWDKVIKDYRSVSLSRRR